MYRRNSTSRLGVDRRKSTSSLHSKHEPLDSGVARQHAQAAASLAYSRGLERKSVESSWPGLSRNNTTASQTSQAWHNQEAAKGVKRQQSVRFVGPNSSHPRPVPDSRPSQPTAERKISGGTLRPIAMTTNAPVPAVYRPPSRSSSIGKASAGRGGRESYVAATAAFDEYYTREDDIASVPSSYRRIRKSKSMFGPGKPASVFYTNSSPARSECYTSVVPTPRTSPLRLKAPKSMSFLRGRRDSHSHKQNDKAIQLARDKFFHETAQQRLREQPSFLFRARAQKQERSFRKSVRSSSNNSSMPSVSQDQNKSLKMKSSVLDFGLKGKARKLSKNMKDKLKWAFGRSKEPVEIPNQHVHAIETHVRDYDGALKSLHGSFVDVPHSGDATLIRVRSLSRSLRAASPNLTIKSQAGSIISGAGSNDDKSRVTSWNNTASSAVDSMASQATRLNHAERELQRLSIINENGTHLSTAAFHRPKVNASLAYPVVHRPSKGTGHIQSSPVIDSARVYSALMKRLDENSPRPSTATNGTPATIRQVQESVSSRAASSCSSRHQVPTEHENTYDYTQASNIEHWCPPGGLLAQAQVDHEDDVFSIIIEPESQQDRKDSSNASDSYQAIHESVHTSNHSERPKVRESRSTFFGGGPSWTIGRTPSPFRRAMAVGEVGSVHQSVEESVPRREGADTLGGVAQNDWESVIPYSPSAYSRTGGGRTPAPGLMAALPSRRTPVPNTSPKSGAGMVLEKAVYRPQSRTRGENSTGSVEWQRWMSSEVARSDPATKAMPHENGHVRERTQIVSDDEEEIENRRKIVAEPEEDKMPLGTVQQNIPQSAPLLTTDNMPILKPILKNRSTISLVENVAPNSAPASPPPIPNRSPLRAVPRASPRSVQTASSPGRGRKTPVPASSVGGKSVKNTPARSIRSRSISRPRTPGGEWSANRDEKVDGKGEEDIYGVEGAGLLGPRGRRALWVGSEGSRDGMGEAMGGADMTKDMVEAFLSERRRRMASGGTSDEEGAFV